MSMKHFESFLNLITLLILLPKLIIEDTYENEFLRSTNYDCKSKNDFCLFYISHNNPYSVVIPGSIFNYKPYNDWMNLYFTIPDYLVQKHFYIELFEIDNLTSMIPNPQGNCYFINCTYYRAFSLIFAYEN